MVVQPSTSQVRRLYNQEVHPVLSLFFSYLRFLLRPKREYENYFLFNALEPYSKACFFGTTMSNTEGISALTGLPTIEMRQRPLYEMDERNTISPRRYAATFRAIRYQHLLFYRGELFLKNISG